MKNSTGLAPKVPKIVLIRGAPAAGKTTLTKKLSMDCKLAHHLSCAYIAEDNFRKQLQQKYISHEAHMHLKSADYIQSLVLQLLNNDSYDIIFIEGLFRYKEVLDSYEAFCIRNELILFLFELRAPLTELYRRDSEYRKSKAGKLEKIYEDISHYASANTIILDGLQPIDVNIRKIFDKICSANSQKV